MINTIIKNKEIIHTTQTRCSKISTKNPTKNNHKFLIPHLAEGPSMDESIWDWPELPRIPRFINVIPLHPHMPLRHLQKSPKKKNYQNSLKKSQVPIFHRIKQSQTLDSQEQFSADDPREQGLSRTSPNPLQAP